MADNQGAWLAILTLALKEQATHAQIVGGIDTQIQDLKATLSPQGMATKPLVNIGVKVTGSAPGSNATREVLSILMEARREQDKAIQHLELARKRVSTAYAHGMQAALRIERAAREIGGI